MDEASAPARTAPDSIKRTFIVYAAVFLLGLAPSLTGWSTAWQTAGLGLIFPGGGFVALGGWWQLAFVLTVGTDGGGVRAVATDGQCVRAFVHLGRQSGYSPPHSAPMTRCSRRRGTGAGDRHRFPGPGRHGRRESTARELKNRAVRNAYLPHAEQEVRARSGAGTAPARAR